MANDLDIQIRGKQRDIIIAAYPLSRIYSWNVLSHELSDWPGLFRQANGVTHGWVIKRSLQQSEWKNTTRDRRWYFYDVFGFYNFRSGKKDDNSDDEFAQICDTVYEAYKAAPTLNFSGTVERHDLLQWQRITTINCGEETLHFAEGRLKVHICC